MIKKSIVTYTVIFFLSASLTSVWAQTDDDSVSNSVEANEENISETECVSQAQIDAMSDDNVEKLELPVCDEGESTIESDDSSTQNDSTANEVVTATTEEMVEESSFPSPDEKLYGD